MKVIMRKIRTMRNILTISELIGLIYGEPIKSELQYRKVCNYLNKYMNFEELGDSITITNDKVKIDRTIWICWLQGIDNAPNLVKKCYKSIMENKPEDYDLVLLTSENIMNYITLPQFIIDKYEKNIITKTHLSDIIRTELLVMYGGCWVDATVFCSQKIPQYMLSGNMFVFKWSVFDKSILKMSSWWMYSQRQSLIMKEVRSVLYNYWKKENIIRNYFLFHIIFSKIVDRNSFNQTLFNEIPYVNNSNPHILQGKFKLEYDNEIWNIIRGLSSVHKLTYKNRYLQGDIYNFYMALLQGDLDNRIGEK